MRVTTWRQRVATSAGGYLDAPAAADGECRSCGASVPAGQLKCRFSLTNHLGSGATSTNETASTTVLGIVRLVVESATFYGAVAKGGAAAFVTTLDPCVTRFCGGVHSYGAASRPVRT